MTPNEQLERAIDEYTTEVADVARGALARLRKLAPGAVQLVYDNAYALVIGFGATDRASEAVLSVAIYREHVTVCFLWGAELPDPEGLLQGAGRQVRHIRLAAAKDLDRAAVKTLLRAAVAHSETPFSKTGGRMEVRAVSKNKKPRQAGSPRTRTARRGP